MNTPLTNEQLDQIAQVFGIQRKATIKIRDGYVSLTDKVWWRSADGPQQVVAGNHLINIGEYPGLYSIQKPEIKITYVN